MLGFTETQSRTLHLTWIAFFLTFVAWFNMAPFNTTIMSLSLRYSIGVRTSLSTPTTNPGISKVSQHHPAMGRSMMGLAVHHGLLVWGNASL